ncbi:hypothetical protein ADK38_16810, partial [Streptomyces varsoviensis]
MAIEISEDWAKFLKALTGTDWPQANEDELRRVSHEYTDAAEKFGQLEELLRQVVQQVKMDFEGASADAFVQYTNQFFVGGEDSILGRAKKDAEDLSKNAFKTAADVEYTKWSVFGQLALLIAQIALAQALAPFTAGVSEIWAAAAEAAFRLFAQLLAKYLLQQIIMQMVMGIVGGLLLDAILQVTQMLQGNRTEWNTDFTKGAAEFGAISGLVGGPFSFIGDSLGKWLGNTIGKGLGSALSHDAGETLANSLGKAASHGADGGSKDLSAGLGKGAANLAEHGTDGGTKDLSKGLGNALGHGADDVAAGGAEGGAKGGAKGLGKTGAGDGPGPGAGPGKGAGEGAGPGGGLGKGGDGGVGPGGGTGAGTGKGTGAGTGSGAGKGAGAGTGRGTGSTAGDGVGKGAGSTAGDGAGGAGGKAGSAGSKAGSGAGSGAVDHGISESAARSLGNDIGDILGKTNDSLNQVGKAGVHGAAADVVGQGVVRDMAKSFENRLGDALGKDTAHALGQDYGEAFVKNWAGKGDWQALTKSLDDALAPYAGKLGADGVHAFSHELPGSLVQSVGKNLHGNFGYKVGEMIGGSAVDAGHMAVSEGLYNLIFGPDHEFKVTGFTPVAGALGGVVGRGLGHGMSALHSAIHSSPPPQLAPPGPELKPGGAGSSPSGPGASSGSGTSSGSAPTPPPKPVETSSSGPRGATGGGAGKSGAGRPSDFLGNSPSSERGSGDSDAHVPSDSASGTAGPAPGPSATANFTRPETSSRYDGSSSHSSANTPAMGDSSAAGVGGAGTKEGAGTGSGHAPSTESARSVLDDLPEVPSAPPRVVTESSGSGGGAEHTGAGSEAGSGGEGSAGDRRGSLDVEDESVWPKPPRTLHEPTGVGAEPERGAVLDDIEASLAKGDTAEALQHLDKLKELEADAREMLEDARRSLPVDRDDAEPWSLPPEAAGAIAHAIADGRFADVTDLIRPVRDHLAEQQRQRDQNLKWIEGDGPRPPARSLGDDADAALGERLKDLKRPHDGTDPLQRRLQRLKHGDDGDAGAIEERVRNLRAEYRKALRDEREWGFGDQEGGTRARSTDDGAANGLLE